MCVTPYMYVVVGLFIRLTESQVCAFVPRMASWTYISMPSLYKHVKMRSMSAIAKNLKIIARVPVYQAMGFRVSRIL